MALNHVYGRRAAGGHRELPGEAPRRLARASARDRAPSRRRRDGEWSDWYAREDPTAWVLPQILRAAAEAPPRPRVPAVRRRSLGRATARSTRAPTGSPTGCSPAASARGESVSVLLPNCEEFVPVWYGILKAGAVMSPINTAYKGDFLSWTINLVESRTLFIADTHLDRLALVAPSCRCWSAWSCCARAPTRGPDARRCRGRPLEALMAASDAEPDGIAHSWTDDARIMFTSGTTGRSKGVIKQNAADYFSARSAVEAMAVGRGCAPDDLAGETYFSCLPLFHSNAQVLCAYPALLVGARVAYVERFSGTRFWQQAIDAGATTFNGIGAILYFLWNQPPSPLDRAHRGAHDLGRAGAEGHLPRVRGALRRAADRGLRPHRDRRRHDDGPHPAAAAGQLRHGQPGLRGHDRGAGHRPAPAPGHPGRDRRGHEDPEHRHARLLRRCPRRPPRTSAT